MLAPASTDGFQFLGATQEAINGRAAMLGFVAAVAAESLTHQAVWSQVRNGAGRGGWGGGGGADPLLAGHAEGANSACGWDGDG